MSYLSLPREIKNIIKSFCSIRSQVNLGRICKGEKGKLFAPNAFLYKGSTSLTTWINNNQFYLAYQRGKSYEDYDSSVPNVPFPMDKQIIYYDESPQRINNRDDFYYIFCTSGDKYYLYKFADEVNEDNEYTPEYYGWDSDDLDKKVLRSKYVFDSLEECIARYQRKCKNGEFDLFSKQFLNYSSGNTYQIYDQNYYDFSYEQIDDYLFKLPPDLGDNKSFPIDLSKYSCILFICAQYDRNKLIYAYKQALLGKEVYVLDNSNLKVENNKVYPLSKDEENWLGCYEHCTSINSQMYDLENLHSGYEVDEFSSVRFDCVVGNIDKLDDSYYVLWSMPDIIGYTSRHDYVRDGDIYVHRSRWNPSEIIVSERNRLNVNLELIWMAKDRNLPLKGVGAVINSYRAANNFADGITILDALPINLRDNDITFNGYVCLWYTKGMEVAEEFVIASLEYFKPTKSLWLINQPFYSDKLKVILESKY